MRLISGLGMALVFAASAAGAAPEPGLTCAESLAAFGVRLNEEALALGALNDVYVDGVVAVPVNLGLWLATVEASDLVARGLVNVTVADPSGTALAGSLELVAPWQWLIWVGEKPFEKNTSYELAYSFVNDEISSWPGAVPQSGLLRFMTGQRSAADDLIEPSFSSTTLDFARVVEPGCCTVKDPQSIVPSSMPCVTAGNCVACWNSVVQVATGSAYAMPTLPLSYFTLDFSLTADERPQTIVKTALGNATFAVGDAAEQYCFHADQRPRAAVDAKKRVSQCLSNAATLRAGLPPGFTGVPLDACVEDVQLTLARRQGTLLEAMFGSSEAEARAAVQPVPSGPEIHFYPQGDDVARSDCALSSRSRSSRGGWAFALLVAASTQRRRAARLRRRCSAG